MKLAITRPLAVHSAARRASEASSNDEVLGQLAMQEAGGIGALGADHAEVGEGR